MVIVGISMFWCANPKLHHIPQWFRMPDYELLRREVAVGEPAQRDFAVSLLMDITSISIGFYIVLLTALTISSAVVAVRMWYHKPHLLDQKLPA
jgi:hypothetical protein